MIAGGKGVLPLARPSQTQQTLPCCLWRIYGLCFKVKVSAIGEFFFPAYVFVKEELCVVLGLYES